MDFEYDPAKSRRNMRKHGIGFEEAKALWADEGRVLFPARSDTEVRFAMLAKREGRIWAVFYTVRDDRVRIISVRRARPKEKELYES